ncbi:MAG: sulfatase-like hydrolase/transferase, partial [Planctomycetes bacterium]|nr:sulfatase-like hydrolase/transferase [Planctomycetota bacterium]
TGNPPSGARYWDPYINTNKGSRTYEGRFGCDVFVDFLIDFIERHQDQPMMLYFPMALTHGPLVSTPAEPDASDKMAKHKAMVRYTDAALGRLVAAIDKLKIRNNTIIIWSTDNGTSGGISGRMNGRLVRGGKAKLTENGVCEPYIVNCPGLVPAGVETDALTDFTDLFPTFCELAGAELPEGVAIDGKSIAPVMLGKDKDGPRDWIMALGHGAARLDERGVRPKVDYTPRVIRDKRYKAFVQDGQIIKLVDLKTDLEEQQDLSDSEDAAVIDAREKFEAVVSMCPEKDARPQYEPTPPQPWDRKANDDSGKKVKKNKRRDRRAKKLRTGE